MKTKQIWANLAVADLERTTAFYTTLGFTPNDAVQSPELTSFSCGENGFVINFFLKDSMENNTKTKFSDLRDGIEVMFSLSAESKEEITEWTEMVTKAGGQIDVSVSDVGPGCTFVFSDPDGHKFNVLYWPGM